MSTGSELVVFSLAGEGCTGVEAAGDLFKDGVLKNEAILGCAWTRSVCSQR